MRDEFIENELIIITKQTYEKLSACDNNSDVLMLYLFYYSVAKWQKTNRVYSTTGFVAKALRWTEPRVRKAKKILIELGLAEDYVDKDSGGKITKHYVRIKEGLHG